MSHASRADKLLIRPTHGDRASAGSRSGQVPPKGTEKRPVNFWVTLPPPPPSIGLLVAEPVDPHSQSVFSRPRGDASMSCQGVEGKDSSSRKSWRAMYLFKHRFTSRGLLPSATRRAT